MLGFRQNIVNTVFFQLNIVNAGRVGILFCFKLGKSWIIIGFELIIAGMLVCFDKKCRISIIVTAFLCLLEVSSGVAGRPEVVGYLPDWGLGRLPGGKIAFDKLDHIIYFSVMPNADGTLDAGDINMARLKSLVKQAHSNKVRVSICAGGWNRSKHFIAMAANPVSRKTFVENALKFCIDNSLDGFDLDWEPVSSSKDRTNYTSLIRELKTAFSPYNLSVSVAVASFGKEFDYIGYRQHRCSARYVV